MNIKEAKKYLITEKIDLSEFFGGEQAFITIREPDKNEMINLSRKTSGEGDEKTAEALGELFPSLIVEHNFEDEGKTVSVSEVMKLIDSRLELWNYVYMQIHKVLPLDGEKDEKK